MTTVGYDTAEFLALHDGQYADDPPVLAIIRYSQWDQFNFKCCYTELDIALCMKRWNELFQVPKIVWRKGDLTNKNSFKRRVRKLPTNKDLDYNFWASEAERLVMQR